LQLDRVCNRLEIQWRARDIHPWDRGLPAHERARLFAAQSLADTESAISEIFEALPHIDVLDMAVLDPVSDAVLLAGSVNRAAVPAQRQTTSSVRMRLNALGVRYRLVDTYFEALNPDLEATGATPR
jgi:hypothetical protein